MQENTTFAITEKKHIEEKIKSFNINYGNRQCTKAGSIEEPCGYQVKMLPELIKQLWQEIDLVTN